MIILNSREIAVLIIFGALLILGMTKSSIRNYLLTLVEIFFSFKMQITIWLLVCCVTLVIIPLAFLGFWGAEQLKVTIVWFFAVGLANMVRLPLVREGDNFFRYWLRDHIKIILIIEFIVMFYTFHLIVELLVQLVLILLFGMLAVASSDPKYIDVKKFLDGVVVVIGFAIFSYTSFMLISGFDVFATWTNLREFLTPIILSVGTFPFFYALHVCLTYERVFGSLSFLVPDPSLRRRAKFSAIIAFGPRAALVERWRRYIAAHRPRSCKDLRRAVRDVKAGERRGRTPTNVPPDLGWSPALARNFLASEGLVARGYEKCLTCGLHHQYTLMSAKVRLKIISLIISKVPNLS